ncbi:ABC transporter permease subunit [Psychromonas sp. MME1]|uniref:ABC transporter permease subunit n=1 Tax=Psychromonas sp. MME1 TaxID=3231032 RepID=UPI0034E24F71
MGEWGFSIIDQQPILVKGLTAFYLTLELCLVAFVTATIIAVPLGIIASMNKDTMLDKIIMTIALISLALPVFWLSVVLTLFPSSTSLPIPIDGDISPIYEFKNHTGFLLIDTLIATKSYQLDAFFSRLAHLFLPSLVLSLFLISELIRLTRNTISTVMKSNFIKAAYAKGFSKPQIIYRHVFKNAMPTIIHNIRLQFNTIISFAMVVEIVFSMQGIGGWLLSSITLGDYLALPTSLLIISLFILISSIFIDILLVVISPVKRKSLYVD